MKSSHCGRQLGEKKKDQRPIAAQRQTLWRRGKMIATNGPPTSWPNPFLSDIHFPPVIDIYSAHIRPNLIDQGSQSHPSAAGVKPTTDSSFLLSKKMIPQGK
jgi:hypothetical protein